MLQEVPLKESRIVAIMEKVRDYNQLLKPNLSGMVVFSSVVGYLLAPGITFRWGDFEMWRHVFLLFAGGMLVTGSANTVNQILEIDTDALMKRTRLRPMPDGRMGIVEASIFAIVTEMSGLFILGYFFNIQACLLSLLSFFLYGFVYTPMKKVHPVSVFIGAIPGALPPLIGWVAATGSFSVGGWVLFLLQFFWQFPHFWAIAWVAFEDYKNAGLKMLPTNEKNSKFTSVQCMLYSMVLIPLAFLPKLIDLTQNIGSFICILCGLVYFGASINFFIKNDNIAARKLMFTSFFYLPAILLTLLGSKL